jgi:hypothetical protein
MNEEWERLSEKFRYQNSMFYLYDIVENFLGPRGSYNGDYDSEQHSQSLHENEKYIQMNNMGTMEIVEEEEPSPQLNTRINYGNIEVINSMNPKSPSFLENDTLQITSPRQNHYNSVSTSKEDMKIDAMTFGGFSNRLVAVPGGG